MQNKWISILVAVFIAGCGGGRFEPVTRSLSEKEFLEENNPWQTYSAREFGITVEAPVKLAYINWGTDLFTLFLHPLVENPVADANYGVSIQFTRIPAPHVPILFPPSNVTNIQTWNSSLHKELAVRAEDKDGITYVRRDIVRSNGDVLCLRGTVRKSSQYKRDVDWAKRILGSVRSLVNVDAQK